MEATKKGEGAKRVCHYGQKLYVNVRGKVPMATKPRGGGGAKGISGQTTKKRTIFFFFSGFPNQINVLNSPRVHRPFKTLKFLFWLPPLPVHRDKIGRTHGE